MTSIALMMVSAVTVEALVQYAKTIGSMAVQKQYKTALTQLAALFLSVGLCISADVNVYGVLGVRFAGFASRDWIGLVLTGIFASRGANYAADILKCLQTAAQGQREEKNGSEA